MKKPAMAAWLAKLATQKIARRASPPTPPPEPGSQNAWSSAMQRAAPDKLSGSMDTLPCVKGIQIVKGVNNPISH